MLSEFLSCLTDTIPAAEFGVLFLYDPTRKGLRARAVQGYNLDELKDLCISPGEGICGQAFQAGQPKIFPNMAGITAARETLSQENKVLAAATAGLPEAKNSVCIPLLSEQKSMGVITLESRRRSASFAEEDLPFLKAVAGVIALSIENARLKRELDATEALREANRLKTELIATLSHEMRTPLTSIKGYSTALLMEDVSFSPDTRHEFLQIIDEECDILEGLVHDLLESSIIDSGLLKLERQPVRLSRLVEDVVGEVSHRTIKHRLLVYLPDYLPIVDADPLRVAQVLHNLLDNAIKYSPQGGLIVVRAEMLDSEVVISVADQGVGIAPEHVNRLFEKGFRVKSGLIRHVAGSGLGLPICQTIVESHGGRIWADSQLGRGTTLFFTIPCKSGNEES